MNLEELNEFVADNLHELSWKKEYPLHPAVGTWAFINGMQEAGFRVAFLPEKRFRIGCVEDYGGNIYNMLTEVSQAEILRGWQHSVALSPRALYDSICETIDRMHEATFWPGKQLWERKLSVDLSNELCRHRTLKSHEAREKMEAHLLAYFRKHHEHVLVGTGGKIADLREPKILPQLISSGKFSLDDMADCKEMERFVDVYRTDDEAEALHGGRVAPGVYALVNRNWKDLAKGNPTFFPSQGTFEDYLWGLYLKELAKSKKYPLQWEGEGTLLKFCECGWDNLKDLNEGYNKKLAPLL
ncbi:MAG: hypothetical protein NT076_03445 [Candidatus Pacearchaeota archaeon]|nr:hypothetical protein [Candidatus Pacearchaeota archaeon]